MEHELDFKAAHWGDCTNAFDEEQKHYVYARCMGLDRQHFSFDVYGERILDIGGGSLSMVLKTKNLAGGKVCDLIRYPSWLCEHYKIKNIAAEVIMGEAISEAGWDEVWMYNVHHQRSSRSTDSPDLRIDRHPPHEGHPHMLTQRLLSEWVDHPGAVSNLRESGCFRRAFHGIFATS